MQKVVHGVRQESLWHVLHVKPRCEKKTAAFCSAALIAHYLPLRREVKKYQRRTVETWKPLFPGYVFACFRPEERIALLRCGQVARILEIRDQALFIDEINHVRRALQANPGLRACQAVTAGMAVRVIAGPFQGLEGKVLKLKNKSPAKSLRVVISVSMIGQGVSIEADEDIIEMI